MKNHIYTVRAMTPLHHGIGQGLSDIDLPTAKSPVTGHPIIPGSSLKGVLKADFTAKAENDEKQAISALFGGDGADNFASAVSVEDANLLALPVRSYFGTFAYLCSPSSLSRLKSLLKRSNGNSVPSIPDIGREKGNTGNYRVLIPKNSSLTSTEIDNRILLEELDLFIEHDNELVDAWANILSEMFFRGDADGMKMFKQRFAIVDDNVLNFLCETALPVDARIAIDDKTGTVKQGALWYEETVPIESLFVGMMNVDRSFHQEVDKNDEQLSSILRNNKTLYCQVGGKSTTGKGFIALNFYEPGV